MDLQKGLRAADAAFEKFFDSHVYRDGINAVLTDEAIKAVDQAKAAFMCNCNYRQNHANCPLRNCPFETNRQYFTDMFVGVQPECKKVTETYWRIAHQFWLSRKLNRHIEHTLYLHTFNSLDQQKPLNVIPFLVYGEEGVKEELFADCIGPITSQELRRILNILSTGQAHE